MPRIIALDQEEEIQLGDKGEIIELVDDVFEEDKEKQEVGVMLTGRALEKSLARNNKKQKFKDLLLWGIQGPGSEENEGEDIISLLTMFLEE